MRTVVITGITGKSGQYFLKRLLQEYESLKDYRFKVICRGGVTSKNQGGYELLQSAVAEEKLSLEILDVDLKVADEVRKVFAEKVDMLFHIASVKLTMGIVPVALEQGVDNIVMVHTTGIYSRYKKAGEEYRQTEAKIGKLIEEYRSKGRDIAATILRPTMIYGDLQDGNVSAFIKMVDKYRLFPTVKGARFDLQPVWCKDLGNAYFEIMTKWESTKNKEYILSGGEPIQLREMFIEIGRQLGVKNTFMSVPFWIAYTGAWIVYLLTFTKKDFREKVQRLVEPRAYPHDLAKIDFGYSPANFADGVAEEIEMYKATKKKKNR